MLGVSRIRYATVPRDREKEQKRARTNRQRIEYLCAHTHDINFFLFNLMQNKHATRCGNARSTMVEHAGHRRTVDEYSPVLGTVFFSVSVFLRVSTERKATVNAKMSNHCVYGKELQIVKLVSCRTETIFCGMQRASFRSR